MVPEGAPSGMGRRAPPRRRRRVALVAATLLGLFVASTLSVLVWPPLGSPVKADAILSLNGPSEGLREAEALSLLRRGYAPILLFSQGRSDYPCPVVHDKGVEVVCFAPNPGRTVGEAEWFARYARRRGLHSVLVVAGRTQAVRALLIVGRCFDGDIHVVSVDTPPSRLPYDIVYGWGALGKALFVDRHC